MDCDAFLRRHIGAIPTVVYPWEHLDLLSHLRSLIPPAEWYRRSYDYIDVSDTLRIHGHNPSYQSHCVLQGDIVFGQNVTIGPFSFLRGPLVIGDNVKIGPYVELARSIVMDGAKISHKNIVVDSVIGENVHLSGFVTTCNVCTGRDYVKARYPGITLHMPRKYGCSIDSDADIGAGVYIMPGAHIRAGAKIPGPCVVYGHNQIREPMNVASDSLHYPDAPEVRE